MNWQKRHLGGSTTCEGTLYKERKMTNIERFVTEGNEKADELAMLDEGFGAEARAGTMKKRERGGVCSFPVCS